MRALRAAHGGAGVVIQGRGDGCEYGEAGVGGSEGGCMRCGDSGVWR